jgi:hypothetical protein
MRYNEFSRNYPYYCEIDDANGEEITVGVTAKFTPARHEYDDANIEDIHVFDIASGTEITHTLTSDDMEQVRDGIIAEHDPHHGPGCEFD